MSDEGQKPDQQLTSRRRVPITVRVIVVLVLYIYSIGPMFWLWYEAENMGGSPLLRAFYTPLKLLCLGSTTFEEFLNEYIGWWIA